MPTISKIDHHQNNLSFSWKSGTFIQTRTFIFILRNTGAVKILSLRIIYVLYILYMLYNISTNVKVLLDCSDIYCLDINGYYSITMDTPTYKYSW